MVIRDKQVDNYKLFAGQEERKCILGDIRYNMDDIATKLTRVEQFMVSDSGTESNEPHEVPAIINAPDGNYPQAKSFPLSLVIISN